jgi:short-subunit dehydrogenase
MNNNRKTVLITGTASGIGLDTALYFNEKGFNVIATMRNPENRKTLLHEKGLDLVHLDVTDKSSICGAIKYAVDKYGKIDVLINNAGYAIFGPFEAATKEQEKREFDTNVFGLIEVTRAIIPVFRKQKDGIIINVTSMGGRIGFPLYALYNSTKWAVEGFTEALMYELKPLNIKVKLIEPGVIKTDFYDRSLDRADCSELSQDYSGIIKRAKKLADSSALNKGSEPIVVAKTIYRAATDNSSKLRYPAGADAKLVWTLRRLLPESLFFRVLEKSVLD